MLRYIDPIECPRHPHVSKQHIEPVWSVEQPNGFISVPSLHHIEPLLLESFRSHQTNKTLVLNKQNAQRGHLNSLASRCQAKR